MARVLPSFGPMGAALGVDLVGCSLGAVPELVADRRKLAGHRSSDGKGDLVSPGRLRRQQHACQRSTRQVF